MRVEDKIRKRNIKYYVCMWNVLMHNHTFLCSRKVSAFKSCDLSKVNTNIIYTCSR